jgi:hypothetical protein
LQSSWKPFAGGSPIWPVELTRPQEEETLTKIVAAIEVEVSIRTAILLWSIGGATPLMAFLFFLMFKREDKRKETS